MANDRLRVRIESEAKRKAMARADEQGVTLSEAIRELLTLWCAGHVDLRALRASYGVDTYHGGDELPTLDELHALGGNLDALARAVNSTRDKLSEFARAHREGLAMSETVNKADADWQWWKHVRETMGR